MFKNNFYLVNYIFKSPLDPVLHIINNVNNVNNTFLDILSDVLFNLDSVFFCHKSLNIRLFGIVFLIPL